MCALACLVSTTRSIICRYVYTHSKITARDLFGKKMFGKRALAATPSIDINANCEWYYSIYTFAIIAHYKCNYMVLQILRIYRV